jgi:peptide chain release factor subunit 1
MPRHEPTAGVRPITPLLRHFVGPHHFHGAASVLPHGGGSLFLDAPTLGGRGGAGKRDYACVTRVFTRAHSFAFALPPRSHWPAGVNTLIGWVFTRLGGGRADANLSGEMTKVIAMKERTDAKKAYLREQLRPSTDGVAVFASAGAGGFFKALQLDAPIPRHRLHVGALPHLYPLARLIDQHPRYVALLADTNSARLFVFGLGKAVAAAEVSGVKVSRTRGGGWSQMRYQRHADNYHMLHAKEVVEALGRVVREEEADQIILAGDEVIIPLLREQLPPSLRDKMINVLRLDIRTSEHEVLKATMESLREHNTQTDAEKVRRLLDEYRAGGLAVVGARDTISALYQGQADELLLSASAREISIDEEAFDGATARGHGVPAQLFSDGNTPHLVAADIIVAHARQTGARVSFVEDTALLAPVGGVGALLRYKL